ncbi:hypothetical protein FQN60_008426, partial [Etheostoma spectabile]
REPSEIQQPAEEGSNKQYYKYEDIHSRPYITPDSEIPENLLFLSHSFGYDSRRRANLQLLDDKTLIFIAGNLLVLLDVSTKEQRYLRSCSGGGIGSITAHPSKNYFVVAEKGIQPNIIVYEYPSLQPFSILRGGTERAYSFVDFNRDGSLLASVGSAPDYMLTLWNWRKEEVMLSCKAVSQEVYRVSFSPYNPGQLTSSGSGHIKFWKMASTFTGLKLQGLMGHFGKTAATDVEGYVELPDGKVVSGTDWGNLLLWDGNAIKVEICRKGGQNCHAGMVQPFALEEGQLMTFGSDGVVRGWDFESIDSADSNSDGSRFELEPMNEMVVGHNVCLSSLVKTSLPDSFVWFAQDSSGAFWKLDLSFTYTTPDPECLFTFHGGPIQAMDASRKSHLMATAALDRSVRVFDFLAKKELTTTRFNQGGTALGWAPPLVNQSGSLLVTGFEDGVVRLLELYDPQRLVMVSGRSPKGDAMLRLKQAFKPHNAPVTAVAYERSGEILATGSSDSTVFFFTVGEKYNPIGFVNVPGPVQALEWSPHSHRENRLLILCQSGHVVEVQSPDPEAERPTKTFQLPDLSSRSFRFRSIKSRIKVWAFPFSALVYHVGFYLCVCVFQREAEIARRQAAKEKKKKEREERLKQSKNPDIEPEEEEEEEEEELPSIYIPESPSPLYCGFYSQQGQFWLSMGGYDSGFLYHCKFSEKQDQDPDQRQDEPFDFLLVHSTDVDPIRSIAFSSNKQLLLCGMHSGSVRVYPLQPADHSLTSMQAYWALSVHDNQYGHLRHIRCSHDDLFVLTVGDDGNIFSFSLLPPEELQKGLQRNRARVPSPRVGLENEALAQDIEDPAAYSYTYIDELQLDQRFSEQAERVKAQRVREVRKQMAWEEERSSIALNKLQDWSSPEEEVLRPLPIRPMLRPLPARPAGIKLADRQVERLRKAAEKAEQARAKIEKRKKEWAQLYAEKPNENCEDPQDVQAIREAKENIGDLKLKSAKDVTVPKHLRMNAERKRAQLIDLEENMRKKQTEMNRRIVTLRDSKVRLVSQLRDQAQQVQKVQQCLAPILHRPLPTLPTILPEETPEKRLLYSHATLERYRLLREQSFTNMEQEEGATSLLEQLEKDMEGEDRKEEEEEEKGDKGTPRLSASYSTQGDKETAGKEEATLSELEKELRTEEEIRLLSFLCSFVPHPLSAQSKLEVYNEQLELKRGDIAKLQEREKALVAAFHASLGEENKFEVFLTKVFKKKIKRVKETEQNEGGDSDEDDEWADDDDYDSTEEGGAALDCSVCPPGCEPELFENTVQLRECRLDLEELLVEEKKSAEALKRECETLVKKEKLVKSSRKAAEDDLELIEFITNGSVPCDLSPALVLDMKELNRLRERVRQLQAEKSHQRDLYVQARQQHVRLIHDRKDMDTQIQVLEKQCHEQMMMKFGRPVDLEALQTLSGNRTMEELKQEKLLREAAYAREIKQWDSKVEEARQALMEVTRSNTQRLLCMTSLLEQKKELEHKINVGQKKMGRQFQDHRRHADQKEIRKLQELVKTQTKQAEDLRREIGLLSRKGVHVPPPSQAPKPLLAPIPTPTCHTHTRKQEPRRPSRQVKAHNSASRQGAP